MTPWTERPTIETDLERDGPAAFAEVPAQARAEARTLLAGVLDEVPRSVRPIAHAVRLRTAGRFQREARSAAAWLGVDWKEAVLASVVYDLTLAALGCSTAAAPTPAGPVVARNLDWWPEDLLARASYLVRTRRGEAPLHATAGWPGSIGVVTGQSPRGFALVLNAVSGPEGVDRLGYPVLLHLRRVLDEARDFADALARLCRTRLAAPCLVTLVGTRNDERVVVERSPRRHALRWPDGAAPLVATNDYRLLSAPDAHGEGALYETACARFDALTALLADGAPDDALDDDRLLAALSDPEVIQTITAQHVIMRPAAGTVRVFVPSRFLDPAGVKVRPTSGPDEGAAERP